LMKLTSGNIQATDESRNDETFSYVQLSVVDRGLLTRTSN